MRNALAALVIGAAAASSSCSYAKSEEPGPWHGVARDKRAGKSRLSDVEEIGATEILRVVIDQLLEAVWGYEHYPSTRTVDTHIVHLRQKLEKNPEDPRFILTIHGTGYKFVG